MLDKDLTVLLCFENVDNCNILLSQLGSGEVFGLSQRVYLVLQGSDENQLEALSWDLQDCAFPLISGISKCTTFGNAELHPDVVMVILTDRGEHSENLLGLVQYSQRIADNLASCNLHNTPIVMIGDMAHIAASVVCKQLPATLKAEHIIALGGKEDTPNKQFPHRHGEISKVVRFCHALRHWWNGQQASSDKKVKLGTKFVNTKQHNSVNGKPTGYFFSGPVDILGPTTFSARLDHNSNPNYIAKIKTGTDAAHEILVRMDGAVTNKDQQSYHQIAHL